MSYGPGMEDSDGDFSPTITHRDDGLSLRMVIGDAIRHVRTEAGARQEDISRAAQRHGLTWSRGRIWDLERGLKALSAEELVMLPVVLGDAIGRPVSITELIPDDVYVTVTDDVIAEGEAIRRILAGDLFRIANGEAIPVPKIAVGIDKGAGVVAAQVDRMPGGWDRFVRVRDRFAELMPQLGSFERVALLITGRPGEAERKAATRLGEDPDVVLALARALWDGRSLGEERDRLVAERPDAGSDPDRLRALRGHITRQLTQQLRAAIERHPQDQEDQEDGPIDYVGEAAAIVLGVDDETLTAAFTLPGDESRHVPDAVTSAVQILNSGNLPDDEQVAAALHRLDRDHPAWRRDTSVEGREPADTRQGSTT